MLLFIMHAYVFGVVGVEYVDAGVDTYVDVDVCAGVSVDVGIHIDQHR